MWFHKIMNQTKRILFFLISYAFLIHYLIEHMISFCDDRGSLEYRTLPNGIMRMFLTSCFMKPPFPVSYFPHPRAYAPIFSRKKCCDSTVCRQASDGSQNPSIGPPRLYTIQPGAPIPPKSPPIGPHNRPLGTPSKKQRGPSSVRRRLLGFRSRAMP